MTIKNRGKGKPCASEFYLEGQRYFFTFNGKKGMPLITLEKDARVYEAELQRQLRSGTFIADSPLQNFGKFYKDAFCAPSRKRSEESRHFDEYYGEHLLKEFGHLRFSQISAGMIERWLVKLSQTKTKYGRKFSPVTVRMHYDRLNQAFNLAIRDRVTRDNPCHLVTQSVLEDFPRWIPRKRWLNKYDPEEEQRLFNELSPQLVPVCRLIINTGLRPPKAILLAEKSHVNLSSTSVHYRFTERDGEHLVGQHILIPPRALLVAHGKDESTRLVPLNNVAYRILEVLCDDVTTGDWLFVNRDGEPMETFKKGFAAACVRAEIDDLRPYDLRHTFATRLQDRYVHQYTISALLGHSQPVGGFGRESRITPNYSHATWEAMQRAVESLEYDPSEIIVFGNVSQGDSDKIQTNRSQSEIKEEQAKAS